MKRATDRVTLLPATPATSTRRCNLRGFQCVYAWVRATWRPLVGRTLACPAILLLAACSDKPPMPSADTSCERFRHISATDAQIKVFADNWDVMESLADQLVEHNDQYDGHCLKEGK